MRPDVVHVLVALLVVMTLAKGTVWALSSPLWQTPDEPAHVASVEHLERTWNVAASSRWGSVAMDESVRIAQIDKISHNPEYPGSLASAAREEERDRLSALTEQQQGTRGEYETQTSGYPPLYYALMAPAAGATRAFGGSYLAQVRTLRLTGVVLTALALVLQFKILSVLFGRGLTAVLGTAFIALVPMYTYMMSTVNPEVMVTVITSALVYGLLRVHEEGLRARPLVLVALSVAAGLLTKQSIVALIPLAAFVLAVAYRNASKPRHAARRRLLATSLGAVAPFAIYSLFRDGAVPKKSAFATTDADLTSIASLRSYLEHVSFEYVAWFRGFWGNFGWLDTPFPDAVYDSLFTVAKLSLAGVAVALLNRTGRVSGSWLIVLAAGLLHATLLIGIDYTLVTNDEDSFMQGRYLFPLIVVPVAIFVYGATRPLTREWVRQGVLIGCTVALAVLHLSALVSVLMPRYSA